MFPLNCAVPWCAVVQLLDLPACLPPARPAPRLTVCNKQLLVITDIACSLALYNTPPYIIDLCVQSSMLYFFIFMSRGVW